MDVMFGGADEDMAKGYSKRGRGDLFVTGITDHDDDDEALREIWRIWTDTQSSQADVVDSLVNGLLAQQYLHQDGIVDDFDGHTLAADLFFSEAGVDRLKGSDNEEVIDI